MKKFIIRLFLFVSIFFLIDKVFIIVRSFSSNKEYDKRLELVLKGEMNKDILILGSSRGARGIIAKQIQDSLGVECFNLSYLNSNIEFHEYLLKKIIKHNNKPKIVMLVIDGRAEFKNGLQFRKDRLIPLINYSEIRQDLIDIGEKNNILSSLFVLNQLSRYNYDMRKKKISRFDSIQSCGSMPYLMKGSERRALKFNKSTNLYNSEIEEIKKVNSFKNFEKICLNNNIKLIYVFPPNFYEINTKFKARFVEVSSPKANIYYYNDKEISYKNESNFMDEGHLDEKGAIIFTNELIGYLKSFD